MFCNGDFMLKFDFDSRINQILLILDITRFNNLEGYISTFINEIMSIAPKYNKFIKLQSYSDIKSLVKTDIRSFQGCITDLNPEKTEYFNDFAQIARKIPCVNMLKTNTIPNMSSIGYDSQSGMKMICDHLYNEGYRKFGFLSTSWESWVTVRFQAVQQFCKNKGDIVFKSEWTNSPKQFHFNEKYLTPDIFKQHITQIISEKDRPDVLICANDFSALNTIKIVLSMGYDIPNDIGLTGYDYIYNQNTYQMYNKLTTIRQDFRLLARLAANLLIEIINGKSHQQTVLKPNLITGITTAIGLFDTNSIDNLNLKNEIYSYIVKNISKPNSQLFNELIGNLSYNKKYFSIKFKNLFGDNFINVTSELKIKQAALEIINTKKPILQILFDYGFSSHQNFNYHFERIFNKSPQEYRRSG
jgi:DNA-binding LacI/PurR family transcriptional regulator